jgi:hypothetical protein
MRTEALQRQQAPTITQAMRTIGSHLSVRCALVVIHVSVPN